MWAKIALYGETATVLTEPLRDRVSSELKSAVSLGAVVVKRLADANMQKLPRLRVELRMARPDGA